MKHQEEIIVKTKQLELTLIPVDAHLFLFSLEYFNKYAVTFNLWVREYASRNFRFKLFKIKIAVYSTVCAANWVFLNVL